MKTQTYKDYYEILSKNHRNLVEFLNKRYSNYEEVSKSEYKEVKKKFYNEVLGNIEAQKFARILDVGCGPGTDLQYILKHRQVSGFGMDLSISHLKSAAAAASSLENCFFLLASALELPFASGVFDMVISSEVIEHLPDARLFVKEVNRVLKKNGVLILTTPNRYSYFTLISKVIPVRVRKKVGKFIRGIPQHMDIDKDTADFNVIRHIHEFSPFELRTLLAKEGFAAKKIKGGLLAIPWVSLFCRVPFLRNFWALLDRVVDELPFSVCLKANFMISARKT